MSCWSAGCARGEVRPDAVRVLVPDVLAGTLIHRYLVRRQPVHDADLVDFVDGFVMPAIGRPDAVRWRSVCAGRSPFDPRSKVWRQ